MRDLLYYAQLALESIVGVFGLRLYEEPRYAVVETLAGGVEVRRYEPRLAAEVDESGMPGADRAFSTLFAYIAGANRGAETGEKIAMTTPVEVASAPEKVAMTAPVEKAPTAAGVRMRFFLPAHYTRETAPVPADPRVRVVEVPAENLAVLRFSGSAPDAEIARRRAALLDAVGRSSWRTDGEVVTLFYDAPFTLPFARRNEVAVAVAPR